MGLTQHKGLKFSLLREFAAAFSSSFYFLIIPVDLSGVQEFRHSEPGCSNLRILDIGDSPIKRSQIGSFAQYLTSFWSCDIRVCSYGGEPAGEKALSEVCKDVNNRLDKFSRIQAGTRRAILRQYASTSSQSNRSTTSEA